MMLPIPPQPIPPRKHNITWKKWRNASYIYAAAKYTCGTHNAKVRSAQYYIDNKYRDLLFFERMLVIGLGVAISPIFAPLSIIYDITKIECLIRGIDTVEVGLCENNKKYNWMYYV
jgi:hypothetical protein